MIPPTGATGRDLWAGRMWNSFLPAPARSACCCLDAKDDGRARESYQGSPLSNGDERCPTLPSRTVLPSVPGAWSQTEAASGPQGHRGVREGGSDRIRTSPIQAQSAGSSSGQRWTDCPCLSSQGQAAASMLLVDEPQVRDFEPVAPSSFLLLKHHLLFLKSSHPAAPTHAGPGEASASV